MNLRDNLNTIEGYQEIISQRIGFLDKTKQKIVDLNNDEKNGIQKYPKPNLEIIELSNWRIFEDYFTILKAKYSIREPIIKIKEDYLITLEFFIKSWKPQSRYLQMLDMISLAVLLEVKDEYFYKLVELFEKHKFQDKIIDFIIKYRIPDWKVSNNLLWPKLHSSAIEKIVELHNDNSEQAIENLKKYLKNWYKSIDLKTHESKWNIHSGYWCWEAGAIVKILNLDDSSFKDQQYYPYDMVHY